MFSLSKIVHHSLSNFKQDSASLEQPPISAHGLICAQVIPWTIIELHYTKTYIFFTTSWFNLIYLLISSDAGKLERLCPALSGCDVDALGFEYYCHYRNQMEVVSRTNDSDAFIKKAAFGVCCYSVTSGSYTDDNTAKNPLSGTYVVDLTKPNLPNVSSSQINEIP